MLWGGRSALPLPARSRSGVCTKVLSVRIPRGAVAIRSRRHRHAVQAPCGSERLPTASWRVEKLFGDIDLSSFYPIFSGYSHGEVFALLRDFELLARGDVGMHYRSVVNEASFKGAIAIASYALYPPGERLSKLFGLDNS